MSRPCAKPATIIGAASGTGPQRQPGSAVGSPELSPDTAQSGDVVVERSTKCFWTDSSKVRATRQASPAPGQPSTATSAP
jgi:hypothetical protein